VQIIADQITVAALSAMAVVTFGDLVKAVADVRRGLIAVDAGMHSMINLRPGQGNRTRSVEDPAIRATIEALVGRMVLP
jgi:hypothetical protein